MRDPVPDERKFTMNLTLAPLAALDRVEAKGSDGGIPMLHAGSDVLLAVVSRLAARLGPNLFDDQRAAASVAHLI